MFGISVWKNSLRCLCMCYCPKSFHNDGWLIVSNFVHLYKFSSYWIRYIKKIKSKIAINKKFWKFSFIVWYRCMIIFSNNLWGRFCWMASTLFSPIPCLKLLVCDVIYSWTFVIFEFLEGNNHLISCWRLIGVGEVIRTRLRSDIVPIWNIHSSEKCFFPSLLLSVGICNQLTRSISYSCWLLLLFIWYDIYFLPYVALLAFPILSDHQPF